MGFWIELGVSGFRVDALPFVIAAKGASAKPVEHYEMLRGFRERLQWWLGDAVMLAEANVLPKDDLEYFGGAGDRMHMMFNFQVNQASFYALAAGDVRPLARAIERTRARPASAQWATFLRNHDELDLGCLTETQRRRVFDAFGPEKSMQLYGRGIRRRLAPMLGDDRRRLELAYSMMFSLPGTPVIRYGDEIAMGDDLALEERNAVRTPMQWSSERHAGFSAAKRTHSPIIDQGRFGYRIRNVADQRRDPESFLNWTERIIRLRKECPEIGWGDFRVLDVDSRAVLALRYEWRGTNVIMVHNLDAKPRVVTIAASDARTPTLVNMLADRHSRADPSGRHRLELEPYGYRWYRASPLAAMAERR